jgi:acetate kinase
MTGAIAVLNAGSSSIKFSLFDSHERSLSLRVRAQVEAIGTAPRFAAHDPTGRTVASEYWDDVASLDHRAALDFVTDFIERQLAGSELAGVGHRVVHGGLQFADPVRVDGAVLIALEALAPLAPLHQPHNLIAIRRLQAARPDLLQVACFDTAFHRSNPEVAQMFALPIDLHRAGIRRYGFHGLSYEYVADALRRVDPEAARGRTIVLHLGGGCSMCAIDQGRSVATTMGFTAIDGLMMGTRSGSLDPGVVLHLLSERGMSTAEVERLLYSESGLLGVSGIGSDMRVLLASGEPEAALAVELFLYRIRRELGALVALLGGLDALVFTAGIGENSAEIRARVCRDAAWAGVELDAVANSGGGPRLSLEGGRVRAWVIPTHEDLMIARHTQRVVQEGSAPVEELALALR